MNFKLKVLLMFLLTSLFCSNRYNPDFQDGDIQSNTTPDSLLEINLLWQNIINEGKKINFHNKNKFELKDDLNSTTSYSKAPIFSAEILINSVLLNRGSDVSPISLINNSNLQNQETKFISLKKMDKIMLYSGQFLPDGNYNSISLSLSALRIRFPAGWIDDNSPDGETKTEQIEAALTFFFQDVTFQKIPDEDSENTDITNILYKKGQILLTLSLSPENTSYLFETEEINNSFPLPENIQSEFTLNFENPIRVNNSSYPETKINLNLPWEDKILYEDYDYNNQWSIVSDTASPQMEHIAFTFPGDLIMNFVQE